MAALHYQQPITGAELEMAARSLVMCEAGDKVGYMLGLLYPDSKVVRSLAGVTTRLPIPELRAVLSVCVFGLQKKQRRMAPMYELAFATLDSPRKWLVLARADNWINLCGSIDRVLKHASKRK